MSDLQAGMLALVVGCNMEESVLGQIVTLTSSFDSGCGKMWKAEEWKGEVPDFIQARFLLPLPPLSDPLDVTHKEELHA